MILTDLIKRHIFKMLMYSEENSSPSKSDYFLGHHQKRTRSRCHGFHYSSPLPSLRGSLSNSKTWWRAPGKATALTIIKRAPTPHHESASIGHFPTDLAILGNNSFTASGGMRGQNDKHITWWIALTTKMKQFMWRKEGRPE